MAFHTVFYSILLSKLDHYGVRGSKSFLNRRQYVRVNCTSSDIELITNGVAQVSTLGPVLFLLYINGLNNSNNCLPPLFGELHLPGITALTQVI